jgi:hypothetical protein
VAYAYFEYPLQVGNVFLDSAVGTDTSYETLVGTYKSDAHFYDDFYWHILDSLKYVFNAVSLTIIILALVIAFKNRKMSVKVLPSELYLVVLFLAYLVMILITDSFFDRYQLPVIAMSLLLYAHLYRTGDVNWKWAVLPFLALFYVSVFGTRDYFKLNTIKWEQIEKLKKEEHVSNLKIHGGFEQICWNDGNKSIWYDFALLYKSDYLIQYQVEDSFQVYRELPIQRFLPPKKDTLRVFKRYIFARGKASDSVSVNK